MKKFKELSNVDQGLLLLAHHQGKPIQFFNAINEWDRVAGRPSWSSNACYRVKPEPKYKIKHVSECGNAYELGKSNTTCYVEFRAFHRAMDIISLMDTGDNIRSHNFTHYHELKELL